MSKEKTGGCGVFRADAFGCNKWKNAYVRPTRCSSHWFCRRAGGAASGAAPERAHCHPVQAGPKRRAQAAPVIYVYGCQADIYGCNTSGLQHFFCVDCNTALLFPLVLQARSEAALQASPLQSAPVVIPGKQPKQDAQAAPVIYVYGHNMSG